MKKNEHFVIGVDYGTDSVRAVIVDGADGETVGTAVHEYARWKAGNYCNPAENQFRQHPLDYVEGLESSITEALKQAPNGAAERVRGISIDTTGSTPCAVDKEGKPLALTPGLEENPNAMFVLWKDHTAVKEAAEINDKARTWGGTDFTQYEGGIYSSEWFWSKILHVLRNDESVRKAAFSWVEHCDWIPALLTGVTDPLKIPRSRTAAGHKAMWHASWGGLPSEEFLTTLDPLLAGLRDRLYTDTQTGDQPAGKLSKEWAERLGLSTDVIIGVGAFDAHFGAVGGGIEDNALVKVMGTSTCDMITTPLDEKGEHLVKGICGQVDGSIIPGVLGMEAGQSAFGDIYAWFKQVLMWPVDHILDTIPNFTDEQKVAIAETIGDTIIPELSREAEKLPVGAGPELAVDWMNGRRTPDANQALKGAIFGLNLGSDAPRMFRALVEATAFGAKQIVDRFVDEGVEIKAVIAIGGIPKKSPFVMQVSADVLNMPIKVVRSEQACALGSAMAAATASGLYPEMRKAQQAMSSGFEHVYEPIPENVPQYAAAYEKYIKACQFIENELTEY